MAENKKQGQSMLNGAFILVVATVLVKVIGALYKMPLTALIGGVGRGYFSRAYDIYTPVYAIAMAGLPVAVSKLVSQEKALGHYRDIRVIMKTARKIFLLTGSIATIILMGIAYPYSKFLIHAPDNWSSIMFIAPSVFFCCCMSSYRGYYEGLSNMVPTAISQVIEALGKLVLGLATAYVIMTYGLKRYAAGLPVFGQKALTEMDALSAIYPYTAAGAISGVTLGTVLGLIFLIIRHKVVGDGISADMLSGAPAPQAAKSWGKLIVITALPVAAGSLILNVTNLIDSVTISNRLAHALNLDIETFKTIYATQIATSNVADGDIATYLYGAYTSALDFKNLIPTITMTLGISAIPALSAAWAIRDRKNIKVTIESVIRITMLVALPAGFGMAVLAEPILGLVYNGTDAGDIVTIAAPILRTYGFAIFLFAVSSPVTNMLQAVGRMDIPLKSIVVGAIVKIILNYILVGNPKININGAPIGSIVCYVIIVLINVVALIRITDVKLDFKSIFIKPLICSAICGASALACYKVFGTILKNVGDPASRLNGVTIATLIAVVAAVFAYVTALLLVKGISKDDVEMLPKGEKIAKALEKKGILG
ncbi:MAG: polysaccharide biosynthesis protein [Clostridia bacterium]|nr:polysaccharide biosynthesis protein [Clostridia bacterium]